MLADHLPALLAAASIQAVGALSPGPAVALVAGVALERGRRPALATALGLALGSAVLALAVVLGLAALLTGSATAMLALRLVGGAYLLWLALQAFRRALRPSDVGLSDAAEAPTPAGPRRGLLGLAAAGLLFQVTNPKSLLVWVAVSAVSGVHAAPAPVLAAFLAGAFLISLAAHGGWGLALATAPARAVYARARRSVEAALGAAFATAGLSLLAQRG